MDLHQRYLITYVDWKHHNKLCQNPSCAGNGRRYAHAGVGTGRAETTGGAEMMVTVVDAWSLELSDSECDQEEESETMGMETGKLSTLTPLKLIL